MESFKRELTVLFFASVVLIVIGIFGVMYAKNHTGEEFAWDYMINLHRDSIIIVTDYGDTLTIHADSLQTFIEEDNL